MEIKLKNNKIRIEKKKFQDGRYGTVNTFKVTLLWKLTCFEIEVHSSSFLKSPKSLLQKR